MARRRVVGGGGTIGGDGQIPATGRARAAAARDAACPSAAAARRSRRPPAGAGGAGAGRAQPDRPDARARRPAARIYVAVLTLLFAVAAIWLGATATKKARRSGTARPRGAVAGVLLGGLGVAFSALWLLVLAVFWPQLNAYYNCLSVANTVAAQQACHTQFTNSVGGEISVLQNGK